MDLDALMKGYSRHPGLPIGVAADGTVSPAVPGILQKGLVEPMMALDRLMSGVHGTPDFMNDPEGVAAMADDSMAATGLLPGPGALAAPANAAGAFGGRLFGRSNVVKPEAELATLRQELAGLNARHKELTGRPLPPRPQPRETSPDALVPSLRNEIDDVRALVAQHETANRPQGQSIVPRVADRTDERAFVQQQFEEMPAAGQSFKGRQGLASRKEQQRLLTEYYSRPGDKAGTPDPWGGEPRGAHGAPLQHKEIMQAQVDYENAAKQVVANNKELVSLRQQRLTASRSQMRGALSDAQKKIKELEDQNSALNNVIMRANSIMKKGL